MRYFHPFLVGDVCCTRDGEAESRMTMNHSWEELYRAALLEVQAERLQERIEAAETNIRQRNEELQQQGVYASEEQMAMADALRALRVLAQSECQIQGGLALNPTKGSVAP